MKRRDFLKVTLATAGGLTLGLGCGDDGKSTPADAAGGGDTAGGDALGDAGGDMGPDSVADVGPPDPADLAFPQSVASGDPKPDSVILWTRVEDAGATGDLALTLEVATDETFTQVVTLDGGASLAVTAEAAFDHCVKVRVAGLTAATTYYYRFTYAGGADGPVSTRVGRTRTAPAPDADVPVRFAWVNCQDLKHGEQYNSWRRLAQEDVDFVVHLGDYIYERSTVLADMGSIAEPIVLPDTAQAVAIGEAEGGGPEVYAAKTVEQYRALYRQYRGRRDLQAAHERFPFINIWDDHEYANDCHGTVSTDFAGRVDEDDPARRKAANQVFFEYQPLDYEDPAFRYDPSVAWPDDIRIYRDFDFGQHLHLAVTDLRTYRPDHPVPEDALPGAVAVTQEQLTALGQDPANFFPYVDIDTYDGGTYKAVLVGAATLGGWDPAKITGNIDVSWINGVVEMANGVRGGAAVPLIDPATAGLERGFGFVHIGKTAPYGDLGARNLCVRDTYELYTAALFAATGGASEDMFGQTQQQWLLDSLTNSTQTWKLWGSEFCLTHLGVDLSGVPSLPDQFKQRFLVLCDDWTCMPNKRDEIIEALAAIPNCVTITGDVHAAFAGTPFSRRDPSKKVVELVGTSISSQTIRTEMLETVNGSPTLKAAGAAVLAYALDSLVMDPTLKPSPQMAYMHISAHGFSVCEVDAAEVRATYYLTPEANVMKRLSDAELAEAFTTEKFKVLNGQGELWREIEGVYKRWDLETTSWVDA